MSDSPKDRASSGRDAGDDAPETDGTKGRATPKRKEAQEANRRPLVPTDRRAAYQADRAKRRQARERANRGLREGDERYMPERDRGRERRFARDYVDARRNLGEIFLPVALIGIVVVLVANSSATVAVYAMFGLYAFVAAAVLDAILLGRRVSRLAVRKFGPLPRGVRLYVTIRAFQTRRVRVPPPMVKRGEYPS